MDLREGFAVSGVGFVGPYIAKVFLNASSKVIVLDLDKHHLVNIINPKSQKSLMKHTQMHLLHQV